MGIQGLLQFLKDENVPSESPIENVHLRNFANSRVAVDVYSWLHKGVYGCANDIFLKGITTGVTDYCMKQIKALKSFNITPVLVFDGDRNPLKIVEEKRKSNRDKAKVLANDYLALGNNSLAYKYMAQSIDVTSEMAANLMVAARNIGVECIVAPYEADAQLVHLEKEGLVEYVITEDSDLIIYGCRKIIFKYNSNGSAQLFSSDKLSRFLQMKYHCKEDHFECLRFAALMSGCDYLENIPRVGLVKAFKFMTTTVIRDPKVFLKKVNTYLKLKTTITDDYIGKYMLAYYSFLCPIVFNPIKRKRVHLFEKNFECDYYQAFLRVYEVVKFDHYQIALGNMDRNGQVIGHHNPNIWNYPTIFVESSWRKPNADETVSNNKKSYSFEVMKKRGVLSQAPEKEVEEELLLDQNVNITNLYQSYKQKKVTKTPEPEEPPPKKLKPCKFAKRKRNADFVDGEFGSFSESLSHYFSNSANNTVIEDEAETRENDSEVPHCDETVVHLCESQYSSSSSSESTVDDANLLNSKTSINDTLSEIQNILDVKKTPEKMDSTELYEMSPTLKRFPENKRKKKIIPKQMKITNFFKCT